MITTVPFMENSPSMKLMSRQERSKISRPDCPETNTPMSEFPGMSTTKCPGMLTSPKCPGMSKPERPGMSMMPKHLVMSTLLNSESTTTRMCLRRRTCTPKFPQSSRTLTGKKVAEEVEKKLRDPEDPTTTQLQLSAQKVTHPILERPLGGPITRSCKTIESILDRSH